MGFDAAGIPQYSTEFLESLFESQKPVEQQDVISSVSCVQEQPVQHVDKPADILSDSTSVVPTIHVSSSPSLLDIEQQRRRELLARKAVIASRKGKQPQTPTPRTPFPQSTNGSSVNTPFKDLEIASAETAPAATVDDFLNSIGPNQPTTTHKSSESPPPIKAESDDMDVDEIPGLGGIWPSEELTAPIIEPPPAPVSASVPSTSTLPPNTPEPIGTPPEPLSSGESTPLLPEASIASQRRGTKRPVAADFVDAERAHTHSYYPPFSNGQSYSYANRKIGGFAGITSTRRCVIDLSDSEGEDYSDGMGMPPQPRSLPTSRHGSFNSHFTANGQFGTTNTPPSPGLNSLSGATLLEKELEIKRMREMIAQKEQMRLRKLVSVPMWCAFVMLTGWLQISARNTPGQSPSPAVPNAATPEPAPSTPALREEDIPVLQPSDDVAMEDITTIEPRTLHSFRLSTLSRLYY